MNNKVIITIICLLVAVCLAVGIGMNLKGGNPENEANLISNNSLEAENESDNLSVSFSVNCEKAAEYGEDFPKYLIGYTKCDVKNGTTVFDLLSEQCEKNGIAFVHQNKSYIKSIGGLSEKDCGNASGWIYKVNGVKPMMSASKYVLKDGDVVEWYYVTAPTD